MTSSAMVHLSKSRRNDDNVTTNGYDTGNSDNNTGDELALHCRRVHQAGDRHRHAMRGNLLQNCWGDFFPSFFSCLGLDSVFAVFATSLLFSPLLSQSSHYAANPIWNQRDLKLRLLSPSLAVSSLDMMSLLSEKRLFIRPAFWSS